MMVDFSAILTLLIAIIPIILIIAILSKFLKGKLFIFPFIMGMMAFPMAANFTSVRAAASLEPDSGTLMADIPVFFTASGLTASTAHHVNVTVGGTETVAIASVTSNADGEASFSLTFTTEGSTLVEISQGAAGSGTGGTSGNFNVIDMVEMIMPYIVLAITLSVIFGVAAMLGNIVKKR